jgi:hypothetical protein
MDQTLGDISKGVTTRSRIASVCEHYSFVSSIEPFRVKEAFVGFGLGVGHARGAKQFLEKRSMEFGSTSKTKYCGHQVGVSQQTRRDRVVTRNKARLVAKCYAQVIGLDFEETFAPVARLKSRIL